MQTFEGLVVSAKTPQTVKVTFDYFYRHPKYKKILRKTTKLLAHCEIPGIKEGDKVLITKCKPYSKLKHFIVTKKV